MLSHYRLEAKIGEGGMGEVWRAVDSTLNRPVAIKILPPMFSEDAERLARFEREARLLASLSHPNIAVIHGLHSAEGIHFLAMELIQGEDLAQRLGRGALPIEDSLDVAKQIAEALEAAHESGVIHRDLKPANVQITPDGKVKVLDFGLAKAFETESGSGNPSMSPTITSAGTRAGMILGTAAYMSPEQARGRSVDRRTDIWSFGCVLYEMLTARQAFGGETISDTIAAVLRSEPDYAALPAGTPARIRDLLRRCLKKDPKRRLQAIGDGRLALEEALEGPAEESPAAAPAVQTSSPALRWLPWLVAGVLALALVTSFAFKRPGTLATARSPIHLKVEMIQNAALRTDLGAAVVMSPDGKTLAFVAGQNGNDRLYVRRLDRKESTVLSGTEGARAPFFSPDGRWVAFFSGGRLLKVGSDGGAPVHLADLKNGDGRGGTWGDGDVIVFAKGFDTGLFRVAGAGGKTEPLTELAPGSDERSHRWPSFIPGGKAVVFMTQKTGQDYDDADVEVVPLDTRARKVVLHGGSYPRVAAGALLFVRENVLLAAPFDSEKLMVTGPAKPVVEGIRASTGDQESGDGSAQYALSSAGNLVYRESGIQDRVQNTEFLWVDRAGRESPAFQEPMRVLSFAISPDGNRVAMAARTAKGVGVWVRDLTRGATWPVSADGDGSLQPVWSRDGLRLARAWRPRNGERAIRIGPVDGAAPETSIPSQGEAMAPTSWSPDGKFLLVEYYTNKTADDFGVLSVGAENQLRPFVETPGYDGGAQFSPDGRWVAYYSDGAGSPEIYVTSFPGPGPRLRVSTAGGGGVRWSHDGREIYFVPPQDRHLMAVTAEEAGGTLHLGAPRQIYSGWLGSHGARPVYDVHPDGKQFLVIKRLPQDAGQDPSHVVIIFDWAEELGRILRES
jgi:Tol biopolymer transport system component